MNRVSRNVISLAGCFVLFFYSCKTKGPIVNFPVELKNKSNLIEDLKANEFQFETLSGKASVTIESKGKKNSIKAAIRMKKDSAIWVNFSYIGFAGARVLITEDSIKIINYKDEQYLISDLNYINNRFHIDVDFETIQSLLIGNSSKFEEDDKLKIALDDDRFFLSSMRMRKLIKGRPEKRLDKLERKQEKNPDRERYVKKQERKEEKFSEDVYSIWMDRNNSKIVKTLVTDFINEIELVARYDDFKQNEEQLFPYLVNLTINAAEDSSKIKIEYGKMVKNKPVSFSFNIPKKYEQVLQ